MTPERIDELMRLLRERVDFGAEQDANDVLEALTLAKSAIPSGQVAEDVDWVETILNARGASDETKGRFVRISAQAQSAENYRGMWQDAERGRMALIAERGALKAKVEELEEAINGAGGWRYALAVESRLLAEERERCARLSAAGQVLSEHVDKEQCPCLTDSPMSAERECPEHDAPRWTMRDAFAKAAMQGMVGGLQRFAREATMQEMATRAYCMADAMVSARGGAVDFTPEQEKERETEARKDAAEQMRAACLREVEKRLLENGFTDADECWDVVLHAIAEAKP